jgi:nicotinate-nucleotide--dimethylbenzimidazole phosphoribosyltransferase
MHEPRSFADIRRLLAALPEADAGAARAARERDATLTKPAGSLGRLEELAEWHASWRGGPAPLARPQILIFAADHGVTAHGVSAFPAEVTAQMVANFERGGAAINQLASLVGARLDVHALDLGRPTGDLSRGPAMSGAEAVEAFATGMEAVDASAGALVTGEMGIGNTTAAAAIAAALLGGAPDRWVGRGTGVDAAGVARKREAVARGLEANPGRSGLEVLAALGGREIAAMAGAILGARLRRVPVLLDGYICSAAALALRAEAPDALAHCRAGHLSAEGAHGRLLDALGMEPILDLRLRLGEGSGAALALQVLAAALACHAGMATFAEAGVSEE